jgi:hypothetical protein
MMEGKKTQRAFLPDHSALALSFLFCPPPMAWLHVVLDLDGTLVDEDSTAAPCFRPHVADLLGTLFATCASVSLWTAASVEWLGTVERALYAQHLVPPNAHFLHSWHGARCSRVSNLRAILAVRGNMCCALASACPFPPFTPLAQRESSAARAARIPKMLLRAPMAANRMGVWGKKQFASELLVLSAQREADRRECCDAFTPI